MRFFVTLLFVAATFAFAQAPTDTLFVKKKLPRLENAAIMFPGASGSDMPVGVWRIAGNKTSAGTIVWFHGGMTSNNCQKGLVAGSDMSKMLPTYTVVSASACKQSHWVEPTTIEAVDEALAIHGAELVGLVLSSTILYKEWDGRFSRSNKEWAHTIRQLDREGGSNFLPTVVNTHPAILDGFVTMYRKATA